MKKLNNIFKDFVVTVRFILPERAVPEPYTEIILAVPGKTTRLVQGYFDGEHFKECPGNKVKNVLGWCYNGERCDNGRQETL